MMHSKKTPGRSITKWVGTGFILTGAAILIWLTAGMQEKSSNERRQLEAFSAMKAEASAAPAVLPGQAKEGQARQDSVFNQIEGVLEIPQIDLKAPVSYGADERTLADGLGAIENMDEPGEAGGSYAIAGHQSYVFGQYFNRLHEMKKGQQFTFETLDGMQRYEVFDIHIVKPEQVEVLDRQQGISLLSLITCYPERSNEYRLVVQAKRVE